MKDVKVSNMLSIRTENDAQIKMRDKILAMMQVNHAGPRNFNRQYNIKDGYKEEQYN